MIPFRLAQTLAARTYKLSKSSAVLCSPQIRSLRTTSVLSNTALTNMLGDGPAPAVQVKSAGDRGIELADGLLLRGACIFISGRVFLWDVPTPNEKWTNIGLDHFEVFDAVIPKPELLLLGTGRVALLPPPGFRDHLNKIGVQVDVMDTRNACSTYNLLAEEGRRVAAALLPIQPTRWERK